MESPFEPGIAMFLFSTVLGLCFKSFRRYAFCLSSGLHTETDPIDMPYHAYQLDADSAKNGHIGFRAERMPQDAALARAKQFIALQNQRRSVRFFSRDPVPLDLLLQCIATAGTAPSGAHQQPWHFCVVHNSAIKRTIREIVEKEEQVNYDKRMKKSWVKDVEPLVSHTGLYSQGTVQKPYLTEAPYLVVVTELVHGLDSVTGEKKTHYYVKEGVGLAVGLFLAALTNIGLFTLTSTPLNAGQTILTLLNRPSNEKLFLLMPVGYPADDATVPHRSSNGVRLRKDLEEIYSLYS